MIDAIQVAAMDAAANPAAARAVQPQAAAVDVREFAQALERNGGVDAAKPGASAEAVSTAAPAGESASAKMMVNAFDSLNGAAKDIESLSRAMSASATEMSPGQMLEMTMQCHQFLFQSQLTSNVANRTSDGVQQLFRQQS
ncbi:hypothetical protein FZO89_06400 [Luteimonas viscosa]|uniref:Uncharacterized protein n=1 Tax=Luteimonas viscosa TaxID=1132694 RepID=A0A5D4XPP4_9GAMM|nr:hypothetical protein [Luteimonas viscosa]TYT25913.1 hypothetical protein FZO89_06400 [Luteimonas viscosa]